MTNYLISYDLDAPGPKDYELLDGKLRAMGGVRVLYSQWIVRSNLLPSQLEQTFMQYIDPSTDSFLVVQIAPGTCAWNKLMVSDAQFRGLLR